MNKHLRVFTSVALGEVAKVRSGFSFSSNDFRDIGTPVIRISDIYDGRISSEGAVRTSLSISDSDFILNRGDFAIAMSGATTGKIGIYNGPQAFVNQRVGKFVLTDCGTIHKDYLYHFVSSKYFSNQLNEVLEQGAQPNISSKLLETFLINFPADLDEQKVIAKALSDIDELIEGIVAETHKKRNILKGFQQSLISGDYFRENNISFEIKLIQNLPIEIKRGQLITGTTKVDGNIPVIAGGISAAYFNNIANRFGTTITISASGANAGFVNLWRSDIWASDCSTIGESELYEVLYIFYVLKEKQKELFEAQYGGGQPHIRPKEIGEISIPWISKANQEDLVVILEGMSKEIELLETELAKYECIKQGMAHDLLTGKVRLV
jgi:type I restriction enzyme S subunit